MKKKEELLRTKNKKLQTIEGIRSNLKADEATIKTLEKEVKEIDAEVKKLSGRVGECGTYYLICFNKGKADVDRTTEVYSEWDDTLFDSGNYFSSIDEALEFADYINFRLRAKKWQRENDPDFKPDWTDKALKFFVAHRAIDDYFHIGWVQSGYTKGAFYFSSEVIAKKFKDEFADELKRGY